MNKPIQLRLFCSEESFRSEFAARLLTFYGATPKAEQENSLSEDDVIGKLESEEHDDMPMRFFIDQFEFEIVWKNDIQIEKGKERENNITLFLLLLELKEKVSESLLETLQEYEISKNSFFVIIDKISDNKKDAELQSYESDVLDTLNSNLNVMVNETHILTVLPEVSESSKVLICDKFKEIVKSIFEISYIEVENQNSKDNLDDTLRKMCSEYGIEEIEEFIEEVKNGEFKEGCARIKDRKARKALMETLTSFTLLNEFILEKQKSTESMQTEANKSHLSVTEVTSVESSKLTKIDSSISKLSDDSRERKTVDFASQLKWPVSQDLILILKEYLSDPEAYLDCLFTGKMYEVIEKVKKSEQHLFLERINACESYQEFLHDSTQEKSENNQTKEENVTDLGEKENERQKLMTPILIDTVQINFELEEFQKEVELGILVKETKQKVEEMIEIKSEVEETGATYDENGDRYEGDYKNGKRDGKGILFYANGDKYVGEFKNGLREGKGIYVYVNGDQYEGEYKNDNKEGKGTESYAKGNKYEGEWKNGLIEGKGTGFYADGGKYEGEWKNGERDGKGILFFANGAKYDGEFKNNKRDGKGTLTLSNGTFYECEWQNDKIDGKGIFIYSNGDKYEGEKKNDKREGKGTYFYVNGNKYEGEWKNGNREGKGIFTYLNGDKYEGEWKNGNREGTGTSFNANGIKYKGEYKNDKREGKGISFHADGSKYEGDWNNGTLEGKGTYFYADGGKFEGYWENGHREGKGILTDPKGKKIKGIWSNDARIVDCNIF